MKTLIAVVLLTFSLAAAAQTPANADLEPAVHTSAPATSESVKVPAAAKPAAKPASTGAKPVASKPTGKAMDRLELEATQITGNRELPKVMYVVPWRRADLGDLEGRPTNSLLDEALAPVDRDVFRRQSQYYQALQPDGAAATPASGKDER